MAHQTVAASFILFVALDAIVHGHHQPCGCRRRGKFGLIRVALDAVQLGRGDVAPVREVDVGPGHGYTPPGYVRARVHERKQLLLLGMTVFFLIYVMTVEANVVAGPPDMGSNFGVSVAVNALATGLIQVKSVIELDRLNHSLSAQTTAYPTATAPTAITNATITKTINRISHNPGRK